MCQRNRNIVGNMLHVTINAGAGWWWESQSHDYCCADGDGVRFVSVVREIESNNDIIIILLLWLSGCFSFLFFALVINVADDDDDGETPNFQTHSDAICRRWIWVPALTDWYCNSSCLQFFVCWHALFDDIRIRPASAMSVVVTCVRERNANKNSIIIIIFMFISANCRH